MNPGLICGLALIAAFGGAVLQHRQALARQRQALGAITADREGFSYIRDRLLVRRVRWQEVSQVRFQRAEVSDWWSEDGGSWLEEAWIVVLTDDTLTIPHLAPLREAWLAAATRHLPRFQAAPALLGDGARPGDEIVYRAQDTTSRAPERP